MKKKLSICVPTFNRSGFLRDMLRSVLTNYNADDIEIVISDNASTDMTQEVVNEYTDKLDIHYSKNSSNIGGANNLIKSSELAHGDYIWFFSDDDIMTEGAIPYLLNFIESNPCVDYIFYSRRLMDRELSVVECDKQPTNIATDTFFLNGKDMLDLNSEMPMLIGFFSSLIIKKDLWLTSFKEIEIQSEWKHLAILLKAIVDRKCAIIGNIGVLCRLNNSDWFAVRSKVWFDDYISCFVYAKSLGYSNNICNLSINKIISSFSRYFVVDKAMHLRTDNVMDCLIRLGCVDVLKVKSPWFFLSFLPPNVLAYALKLALVFKGRARK